MPRHLLSLRELPAAEIGELLDAAEFYAAHQDVATPVLRGHTVALLFYEPSTRTEISFELAAKRLGAEVVRCDAHRSSIRKGESLLDTVRTLEALGADAIVIRHSAAGASHLAARALNLSPSTGSGQGSANGLGRITRGAVINAGDGMHEHPSQGLLDLFTVRGQLGRIAGLKVAIVGDVRHSRVARSALWGFTKLGATVTLVGPSTMLPHSPFPALLAGEGDGVNPWVRMTSSLEEGLRGADVVMVLRLQLERQAGGDVPSVREFAAGYGLTAKLLDRIAPTAIVMHPGPMTPGIELREDVAYGPRSLIQQQVKNGVFVRMAALAWALERELPLVDRRSFADTETVPVRG